MLLNTESPFADDRSLLPVEVWESGIESGDHGSGDEVIIRLYADPLWYVDVLSWWEFNDI